MPNIMEYVERFVCAVERIASALEKGVEVNRLIAATPLEYYAGTLTTTTEETPQAEAPAETPSAEQPGSDESKRSRPTKEEMAQRRAAAIEALNAAGLALADVEAQLKATSDTWTSRHCEKAMALAAEKMPAQPSATTPPPAETPKNPTEQDINAEKILALVEQVKAGYDGDTGASVAAATMNAFGAGMAPNAVPVNVQMQIIAMLEAAVAAAPKNAAAAQTQTPTTETPAAQTQASQPDPCPVDEKVFNYIRALVGAKPIDTPADAEAIIKSMQSGKPLALEQIRAVAAASVNSKRIADPATINKLVATRAGAPNVKLPEVDPSLYVAICHDLAAQAEMEAM